MVKSLENITFNYAPAARGVKTVKAAARVAWRPAIAADEDLRRDPGWYAEVWSLKTSSTGDFCGAACAAAQCAVARDAGLFQGGG